MKSFDITPGTSGVIAAVTGVSLGLVGIYVVVMLSGFSLSELAFGDIRRSICYTAFAILFAAMGKRVLEMWREK